MTGATGATYGIRLLQELARLPEWESHLVVSQAGLLTAKQELGLDRREIESLADVVHSPRDIGATVASGSFLVEGMVVSPCSMKTLASIANGFSDNLVARAADVTLKQRRQLVLLVRETPLNLVHLRNMMSVTEMGGIIFPPVPAFYAGLTGLEQMVGHTVGRVMDLFAIEHQGLVTRWQGLGDDKSSRDNN
ncbi:MAG: UbiX family flavin prenyltransferase [Gammaproteobacteria bacterium]|nr:UbiX family flavin prenyltransferase [Gammaproteobacteria bacterium]